MQRRPWLVFGCLTLVFAAVFAAQSTIKLLWFDELITLTLARLRSASQLWSALAAGADPNPPGSFLLVMASRRMFGEGALALRLPAACGYWCGLVALFLFLKRRLPVLWALAGALMSMAMAAFDYSFESRSYGLIYGAAMVSWLCWSLTADPRSSGRRRALYAAAMAVALALGVSMNYFAVLATLPIAVGEAVRSGGALRRSEPRTLHLGVWFGVLAGLSPLLAFRGLMEHAIAQFAPYAFNRVSWHAVIDGYTETVESTLLPLAGVLLGSALLFLVARRSAVVGGRATFAQRAMARPRVLPAHEAAAVGTVMAYPVLGYFVASVHGGMLSARFVIPVCLGFAIAGTVVLYRLCLGSARLGVALLCLLVAWFGARETYVAASYLQQRASFRQVQVALTQAGAAVGDDVPIAVPDPLLAMALNHYAPRSLRCRLVFPLDFVALRTYRHDDSPEENLWAAQSLLPTMHIVPLAQFEQANASYLIMAGDNNWLLQALRAQHQPVTRLPIAVHAPDLGGFTPLGHGPLSIYAVHSGDMPVEASTAVRHVQVAHANAVPRAYTATWPCKPRIVSGGRS